MEKYIVFGFYDMGYDGSENWNIAIYDNEEQANEHVKRAKEYHDKFINKYYDNTIEDIEEKDARLKYNNPYDKNGKWEVYYQYFDYDVMKINSFDNADDYLN